MFYYKVNEKNGIKVVTYILEVRKKIKNTDIPGYDIIPILEKEVPIYRKIYVSKSLKNSEFVNIHNLTPEFVKELYG